ncbi:hypothetical protein LAZ67_1004499 [Cordylochernes scorpioides]|uniref:Uncharacterized protein n=1 Tax=Cordylochernes scorpioides TaxID=51811 RepID=A0ABY6JXG9_9ARAC|nr:hypothetical protein LAZ67_1004499 [Cordylochernes scorpioides]
MNRQVATCISRFKTGSHTRLLLFQDGVKTQCTIYRTKEASPDHLLECMEASRQELYSNPANIINLTHEFSLHGELKEVKDKVKELKEVKVKELKEVKDKVKELKEVKDKFKELKEVKVKELKEVKDKFKELREVKDKVKELREVKDKVKELRNVRDKVKELREVKDKFKELKEVKDKVKELKEVKDKELKEVKVKELKEVKDKVKELKEVKDKFKELKEVKVKELKEVKVKELKEVKVKELKEVKDKVKELREVKDKVKELREVKDKVKELREVKDKFKNSEIEVKDKVKELKEVEDKVKELKEVKDKFKELIEVKDKVKELKEVKDKFKELKEVKDKVKELKEVKVKELKEVKDKVKELKEVKVKELKEVKDKVKELREVKDKVKELREDALEAGDLQNHANSYAQVRSASVSMELPLVNVSTCELRSVIQGWQNVHDDERSGSPVTATDNAAVAVVRNVVEADRRVTIDEIIIRLPPGIEIRRSSIGTIMSDVLDFRKVCARWVARLLLENHKQQRMEAARVFLEMHQRDGDQLFSRIVTGDESWVHHSTPETKRQSMVWKKPEESAPKKAKVTISAGKVMAMENFKWEIFTHPPHSPELAPSDFHLYPALKWHLGGKHFANDDEVQAEANHWLLRQDTAWYKSGI